MLGRQPGKLLDIREVDIHGSKFFDLIFALDASPDKPQGSRIGQESVYAGAKAGDEVVLHLVLSQVTRVDKREA